MGKACRKRTVCIFGKNSLYCRQASLWSGKDGRVNDGADSGDRKSGL